MELINQILENEGQMEVLMVNTMSPYLSHNMVMEDFLFTLSLSLHIPSIICYLEDREPIVYRHKSTKSTLRKGYLPVSTDLDLCEELVTVCYPSSREGFVFSVSMAQQI
jgi:hypothetical protein